MALFSQEASDMTTVEVSSRKSRARKVLILFGIGCLAFLYAPLFIVGYGLGYFMWRRLKQKPQFIALIGFVLSLLGLLLVWNENLLCCFYYYPFVAYFDFLTHQSTLAGLIKDLTLISGVFFAGVGLIVASIVCRIAYSFLPEEKREEWNYSATPWEKHALKSLRQSISVRPAQYEKRTILGIDEETNTLAELSEKMLVSSPHGAILGGTGRGKTTTMKTVMTSWIESRYPMFVIDCKGSREFAEEMYAIAKHYGMGFKHVAMSEPGELSVTDEPYYHLPPLNFGDRGTRYNQLIEVLTVSGSSTSDGAQYYQSLKQNYLSVALFALDLIPPANGDYLVSALDLLSDVNRLVSYIDPIVQDLTLRGITENNITDEIDKQKLTLVSKVIELKNMPKSETSSVTTDMRAKLSALLQSNIGHLLVPASDPRYTIDLKQWANSSDIIFVSLNGTGYRETAAQVLNMLTTSITALSSYLMNNRSPRPIRLLIDEFNVAKSPKISDMLSKARQAGVGVWLATQSLADITLAGGSGAVGEEVLTQIMSNIGTKIIHTISDPQEAFKLATMTGKKTKRNITSQGTVNNSFIGTTQGAMTGRQLISETDTLKYSADDLMALGVGEVVCITQWETNRGAFEYGAKKIQVVCPHILMNPPAVPRVPYTPPTPQPAPVLPAQDSFAEVEVNDNDIANLIAKRKASQSVTKKYPPVNSGRDDFISFKNWSKKQENNTTSDVTLSPEW